MYGYYNNQKEIIDTLMDAVENEPDSHFVEGLREKGLFNRLNREDEFQRVLDLVEDYNKEWNYNLSSEEKEWVAQAFIDGDALPDNHISIERIIEHILAFK